MNCNKFIRGVAMLCASSFLWVSCQKDELNAPASPTENPSGVKVSGSIPDDPALLAKVPKITSADFMAEKITNYFSYQPLPESAKGSGTGGRDRTTPTVNILTPTSGSTVSNTVAVQVSANDNVGVTSVVLKVDGNVIATTNIAPYNFSWNTAGLSTGTHTLTATATDAAGNSKISTIQVGYNTPAGADITPPSVSITSPTNGASVQATITVAASASDNIGVSSVSFKVDGAVVSTDNSAPYSFSWNTGTVAAGVHSLTATANDAAGNSNSHTLQVTVNTTTLPPATLPSSFQLSMPPVGDQGAEFSCVAWAVASARSVEKYYKTNSSGYSPGSNIFSPEYIYNQAKFAADCYSGTSISTALTILKNQGVCSWLSMPYNSMECSTLPNSSQTAEAAGFKIGSYAVVYQNDEIAIKTLLTQNHPLIAGTSIDNNFTAAGAGFIWKSFTGSFGTNHAYVICGYDDAKHAFKVMNSWGTAWGDAGYSWIDYDFFGTLPGSVYVIQNAL
jgi:hypothetical protein